MTTKEDILELIERTKDCLRCDDKCPFFVDSEPDDEWGRPECRLDGDNVGRAGCCIEAERIEYMRQLCGL